MILKVVELSGFMLSFGVRDERLLSMRNGWLYQRIIKPLRYGKKAGQAETPSDDVPIQVIQPPPPASLGSAEGDSPERTELLRQVQTVPKWYHSIDLPYGISTPGLFDYRPALHLYGLPEKLDGKRCLDVATFDGFWAFTMEARGGQVWAIDVPNFTYWDLPVTYREQYMNQGWPRATVPGFDVAHKALSSSVERVEMSVYDLDPEKVGIFDQVFCGDLLLHLRDPNLALQRIRNVTAGEAIFVEPADPYLNQYIDNVVIYEGGREDCVWWRYKTSTLGQMILDAGYRLVEPLSFFKLDCTNGDPGPWRVAFRATP